MTILTLSFYLQPQLKIPKMCMLAIGIHATSPHLHINIS